MIEMSAAAIADAVSGRLVGDPDVIVGGPVQTDSREPLDGGLYVARIGEHMDGHRFADDAVRAGAVALLVQRPLEVSVPQIVVNDATRALGDLARAVVRAGRAGGRLQHVIGITGSAGKTTTKHVLAQILGWVGNVVAPVGSFNNEVGAPLTMLRIDTETRFLVVEMGASHRGDVASLAAMAGPDVGIELQVGRAHLGEFGSQDNIRIAKQELVEALPGDGVAVLNADDVRVRSMAAATPAAVRWFGQSSRADVRIVDALPTDDGARTRIRLALPRGTEMDVAVPLLGEHNAWNVAAAVTAAMAVGVDESAIVEALRHLRGGERWRMQPFVRDDGVTIINDAYNASPGAMAAALRTLAQIGRRGHRTIAVLGAMGELGAAHDAEHDTVGRDVVRLNIDQLVVVGREARHTFLAAQQEGSWGGEAVFFETVDDAASWIEPRLAPGDVVLVKSSNAAGLRFLGDSLAGVTQS